jgi:hypothetical protein
MLGALHLAVGACQETKARGGGTIHGTTDVSSMPKSSSNPNKTYLCACNVSAILRAWGAYLVARTSP